MRITGGNMGETSASSSVIQATDGIHIYIFADDATRPSVEPTSLRARTTGGLDGLGNG